MSPDYPAATSKRRGLACSNVFDLERCEPRLREGSERSRHLADAIHGFAVAFGRAGNSQTNVRLEEMSSHFFTGGLQVVFAVMQTARRGFESCA